MQAGTPSKSYRRQAATSLISATGTSYQSSLEARKTKAKMNYWNLIKIESFRTAKETISKTERQRMEWEKIFANDVSDKGLVSKIYKGLIQLNTQKRNDPVKKWAEDMNRQKTSRWQTDT